MEDTVIPTIKIPSIPYFSNIVIFPLHGNSTESPVFVLKKEADVPEASSRTLICIISQAMCTAYCLQRKCIMGSCLCSKVDQTCSDSSVIAWK